MGKQFFYRGYLTSCNYTCGYCPFSKRRMTGKQKKKDQVALAGFIRQMERETEKHALQIVPYGEALIHEYYWEALAEFSRIPSEEYTGCQTNLSFPVEKMLSVYEACGGEKQKLRLWCTFHPSMVPVEEFVSQCNRLEKAGVAYCAGAVGDPADLCQIRSLREQLPEHVYVWINKMDGRRKGYTKEEIRKFQEIDPYFRLELEHRRADSNQCRKSVFQEADGSRYFCNLHASQAKGKPGTVQDSPMGLSCRRKECSCYLAYCNRTDVKELFFFEPYPAFRIPVYPKGIFLDVDGTLVEEGKRALSDDMAGKIRWLAQRCRLFLATALPYSEAMGKCRKIADCLSGGVFADGGHILVWESTGGENRQVKWEEVVPLPEDSYSRICHALPQPGRQVPLAGEMSGDQTLMDGSNQAGEISGNQPLMDGSNQAGTDRRRMAAGIGSRTYQIRNVVYKQTLFSRRRQGFLPGEAEMLIREITTAVNSGEEIRIHREKRHIGILNADANKKAGVEKICAREGIAWEEGMAMGNGEEDLPMLSLFPRSVLVNSNGGLRQII